MANSLRLIYLKNKLAKKSLIVYNAWKKSRPENTQYHLLEDLNVYAEQCVRIIQPHKKYPNPVYESTSTLKKRVAQDAKTYYDGHTKSELIPTQDKNIINLYNSTHNLLETMYIMY